MLERYEWIASERQFFGQHNTAYDFAANDMKEVSRRLSKLQETKEKLGKNVNMRAMNMLGKAEEKVRSTISSLSQKLVDPHFIAGPTCCAEKYCSIAFIRMVTLFRISSTD